MVDLVDFEKGRQATQPMWKHYRHDRANLRLNKELNAFEKNKIAMHRQGALKSLPEEPKKKVWQQTAGKKAGKGQGAVAQKAKLSLMLEMNFAKFSCESRVKFRSSGNTSQVQSLG